MIKTLADYEYEMNNCFRCSHCKFIPWGVLKSHRFSQICPSITRFNFHAYSGSGKVEMALALHQRRITRWTDEMLRILYTCTNCGACQVSCSPNNFLLDLYGIHQALRAKAIEDGAGPMPQHKAFTRSIKENYNPYNEPHKNRFKWLPTEVTLTNQADVVFWAGCSCSFRRSEIAQATTKLLNRIGVDFKILGQDEICCGSPIYQTGQHNLAIEIAENVAERIEKSGARTVITSCAGCYGMFKAKYPNLLGREIPFKVLSLAEVLDQKLKRDEITFNELPMTVTYHDPCHLGRLSELIPDWNGKWKLTGPHILEPVPEKPIRFGRGGCYNAPRNVIKSIPGVKLVEMERIREYSWCCGAGAGCKSAFPEFAAWAANERLEEAEITGADALISACPFCATNFKDAIASKGSGLRFYDLAELALMALQGGNQ